MNVSALTAADTGTDVAAQTAGVLRRADERLRSVGSSLANVVASTVYLRRAADFSDMNAAYRTAWAAEPPTRTTVATDLLNPAALVEMSFVAVPDGAERVIVHPHGWMRSLNPYSYGIRSGETLFLSGLVAWNARENRPVEGDVDAQSRAILDNAGELLAAAGLDHTHVVSARVFLSDIREFEAMTRAYGPYFGSEPPARATVEIGLTKPQYRVEMTLIASNAARRVLGAPDPRNPTVSPAIVAGGRLYVAGIPAADTTAVVSRLGAMLTAAGFDSADVTDLLIYLGRDHAREALHGLSAFFSHGAPACAMVRAGLGAPDATIEVMATAERAFAGV